MKERRLATLGLLLLAAIAYGGLVTWDPRSHAYEPVVGWFFATSDSSPQIIFAIVAALLFHRRRELRAALGAASAPTPAALCLVPAVALHAWARWVDAPDLMVVSLGLAGFGAGFLLGGRPLARLLAAPLALLVFALPLPGELYNQVVYPYQIRTATFVDFLLRNLGYTVTRQADVLTIGLRQFEVIETCSGLRSVLTLGLLASAWAAYFRCSRWHGAGLLAASLGIAFVTNGLRVMVLVLDPRPEVQESHVAQGVVMFLVGTALLSLVDRLFLRLRRARGSAPPATAAPRPRPAGAPPLAQLLPVGIALAAMATCSLALPEVRPGPAPPGALPDLPRERTGWKVEDVPDDGNFLGNVYFSRRSQRAYTRRRERITAFLGWDDRRVRSRSPLSAKNLVPGRGFELAEQGEVWLEPGPVRMQRVVARRFADRELVLYAYDGSESAKLEMLRSTAALDQPGSPWARRGPARFLRLSTPIPPGPGGFEEAEARLRAFYADLPTELREWSPDGAGTTS